MLSQRLSEGYLPVVVQSSDHPFEGDFRRTNGSHGMVNTARPKTALHDFITPSKAQEKIRHWHAHIVEGDMTMAVRRTRENQLFVQRLPNLSDSLVIAVNT